MEAKINAANYSPAFHCAILKNGEEGIVDPNCFQAP